MSTNGNGWKPRRVIQLTCPSGQVVSIRRPGPEFTLRSGKVARTFTRSASADPEPNQDQSAEEYGMDVIASMSDPELATFMLFARDLVVTMAVSPRIVLNPREGYDEIGPDDIGNDFWFLFNYGMTNFIGIKVPVADQEVEAADLETFCEESRVPGDGVDRAHLPPDTQQPDGDQGLVSGAGT